MLGLLFVFLSLAFLSNAWEEENFFNNIFSSMLGAAIVAVITLILLKGQTRSENEKEQNSAIFKKKLEVFQNFLVVLNEVATKKELSESDKIRLQFQIAQLSVHTESKRLKVISKHVNSIVRKLDLMQPIQNSIYDELLKVSVEFHNELYKDDLAADNEDLLLAIRNFSCLKVPERNENAYKLLAWLQDSISLYPLRTRIFGYNDLVVSVEILPEIRKKYNLAASVVNIVVHVRSNLSGYICLFTDDQEDTSLQQIFMKENGLWKYGKTDTMKSRKKVLLDYKIVRNASVLCGLKENSSDNHYLTCLYDTIAMMYPIWYQEGLYIPRRKVNSSINELQVISFKRGNEDIGTVIDEDILGNEEV